MSHLGRPDGRPDAKYSLRPVFDYLSQHTSSRVHFIEDCVSEEAISRARELSQGEILLLENLLFHPEEETMVYNL